MDEMFYFVDLPGYGYSKMSKKEQEQVGKFIEEYLFTRKNITLIILLLDIRHPPTENDKIMYEYIKSTNKPYLIIANKADKIATTKVEARILEMKQELNLSETEILLPFSSERKIYVEETWEQMERIGLQMK